MYIFNIYMTMGPVVMKTNCWDLLSRSSVSKQPWSQSNTEWMLRDLAGAVFLRFLLDITIIIIIIIMIFILPGTGHPALSLYSLQGGEYLAKLRYAAKILDNYVHFSA